VRSDPLTPPSARARSLLSSTWAAMSIAAAMILVYGETVPKGDKNEIDHLGSLQTLTSMKHGEGFYQAFRDSYLTRGVRLGGPRSFRTPYLFLLLHLLPLNLLYPAFLVLVVGGTTVILMHTTDHPFAVLPVTLYLLVAGRTPGGQHGGLEGWLLVEIWVVPLVALCMWGWKREKWWASALAAAGAVLIREIAFPVLAFGLLFSWRRGKPMKPWLVALAIDVVGWAIHIHLAMQVGVAHGNEAKLFGTGVPPWSVYYMLIFPLMIFKASIKFDVAAACCIWFVAMRSLWKQRATVPPTVGLLAIPLLGFLVSRSYWGLPIIPLVLFWFFESLAVRRAARRAGGSPDPSDGRVDGGDESDDAHEPVSDGEQPAPALVRSRRARPTASAESGLHPA
jgi:hypothetical protein